MAGTGLELSSERALTTYEVMGNAFQMAEAIAKTEFVPKALRHRPEAVAACMLAGHEMGIGPMMALAKIDVIEGKPAPAAELMRAIVLAHGHDIWFDERTITRVTIVGQRAGSTHPTPVTWTMDDAKRANLAGKAVWRNYPRAMLTARATGELCRAIFPDVLAGLSYTAEEVEDGWDELDGEPDADETPPTNVRKLPAKKAAARKKAAPKKEAVPRAEQATPDTADLPPLPGAEDDEVVDAEVVDETPAAAEDETKRAQRIAMRAGDVKVDHHDVVYAVTAGRSTSAKGLTDAEAEAVFEALREIKVGEKVLDTTGSEPVLADPPEPAAADDESEAGDGPDLGEVESWDAEAWRTFLTERGVRVVETVRAAQRLAKDTKADPPGSLADLEGTPLAVLVAGWVEDQAGSR